MNNLSEDTSSSASFPFAPLSPQTGEFILPPSFIDPYEYLDSVNDPFSELEPAGQNPTMGPNLFFEQAECIDPSQLANEYPDPLTGLQNIYPYPQAIPNNSEHLLQPEYTHLDTLFLAGQEYPFNVGGLPEVDFTSHCDQNDSAHRLTGSSSSTPESSQDESGTNSRPSSGSLNTSVATRYRELKEFDPKRVYDALLSAPPSFDMFYYTQHGELDSNITFTAQDVERYLAHHPLNAHRSGEHDASGVTLWIQRNPADSKMRYHHPLSARCRFQDCPAVHNLISQGFYRIAVDEHGAKSNNYDPIGSIACHFHLFCMERFLDFPKICRDYNVQVDTRSLEKEPNGRNRMQLGSEIEIEAAGRFLESCKMGIIPSGYPNHTLINRPYENTLSHVLAKKMYKDRGPTQAVSASKRTAGKKSSHWTVHLGNLEVQAQARALTRTAAGQNKRTSKERIAKPPPQRVLKESPENRSGTVKQIQQTLLQISKRASRQNESYFRAGIYQQMGHSMESSTDSSLSSSHKSQEQVSPCQPCQEKKRLGRPPKRLREEPPRTLSPPGNSSSRSRTTLAAISSVKTRASTRLSTRHPSKRLRLRESRVNYVEPDTEFESEIDYEPPVRASKRRRVGPKCNESDSHLSMGDTIVVKG